MTQLLEPVLVGAVHAPGDPNCPFCPAGKQSDDHHETFGGDRNSSKKLGQLIDCPEKFGVSIEANARPKDGAKSTKDGRQNQKFTAAGNKQLSAIRAGDRYWTFQPHHAISGNQALKGDPIEDYLYGKKQVVHDTGYSVNNPQNGVWLPSMPLRSKPDPDDPNSKRWSQKSPLQKFSSARKAMDKFRAQFHLSDHDIPVDADGLDPEDAQNYVAYVKAELKSLKGVLDKWFDACLQKDQKSKKPYGNSLTHYALDHTSASLIKMVKGQPGKWTIFVSRHARNYTRMAIDPTLAAEEAMRDD